MKYRQPFPMPANHDHTQEQKKRRSVAANRSRGAEHTHVNEEANEFAPIWPTNFHKGLTHNIYGAPKDPNDFEKLFHEINNPSYQDTGNGLRSEFPVNVHSKKDPFYTRPKKGSDWEIRLWESPLAGHQFDLQGPAASSVSMAPAPRLGSDELAAEKAEVYSLAILRDVNFTSWGNDDLASNIASALGQMEWFHKDGEPLDADGMQIDDVSASRRKTRISPKPETMFRGSSPGCEMGPYISQFLYQGNSSRGEGGFTPDEGRIALGAQTIDQMITPQRPNINYMTDWGEWLDVQNGAKTNDQQLFSDRKFITTPRDLATYVHFDALYQAYLAAALLMNAWGVPKESGFPESNQTTRDGFATFGDPHILTLVTESATRSLKAVRRQKYNFHLRARPEMLGAVTHLYENGHGKELGPAKKAALAHHEKLGAAKTDHFNLLDAVAKVNAETGFKDFEETSHYRDLPDFNERNLLLPMAFPEGSPMHPAYGAGHATVAGSCVTILKAFFEMFEPSDKGDELGWTRKKLKPLIKGQNSLFVPNDDGSKLEEYKAADADLITLEGELNKLAANISIGRNMAGVHYYSDYFDSLRMGERIAVGLLYEQLMTYTEAVTMRFTSFDDDQIVIKGDGLGGASIHIDGNSDIYAVDKWWNRHQGQPRHLGVAT